MAHMLDFNEDGLARFAYLNQHEGRVWHKEGSPVEDGTKPDFEQWLIHANMDFTIREAPMIADLNGKLADLFSLDLDSLTPKQAKAAIAEAQATASLVESHKLIYRDHLIQHCPLKLLQSVPSTDHYSVSQAPHFQLMSYTNQQYVLQSKSLEYRQWCVNVAL